MNHPLFEKIPNANMAEACSQMFEIGDYKFATSASITEKYGETFPPVPTEILSVVACYLEETPDGVTARTQFAGLSSNMPEHSEISDIYERTIGLLQSQRPLIGSIVEGIPEFRGETGLMRWCMDTASKNGKKLMAAHMIGRVVSDGAMIDTTVYPTEIMEGIPLIIRNSMVKLSIELDKKASAAGYSFDEIENLREMLKPVLRNDSELANLSVVAVSGFLPEVDKFREVVKLRLSK